MRACTIDLLDRLTDGIIICLIMIRQYIKSREENIPPIFIYSRTLDDLEDQHFK
jgi:hypothetical protein